MYIAHHQYDRVCQGTQDMAGLEVVLARGVDFVVPSRWSHWNMPVFDQNSWGAIIYSTDRLVRITKIAADLHQKKPGSVYTAFFRALVAYGESMKAFHQTLDAMKRHTPNVAGFDRMNEDFDNHNRYSGEFVQNFLEWVDDIFGLL
jgi:hypothetical protein